MGNSSYINVIAFVIITILYYVLKPTLTLKREEAQKYKETRYVYLSIYLMVIILTQFFVNVSIIKSTCGGNITENIGPAALFTFMPWLFIFGIMVVVLLLYPGFKSVFADVIGYFYISSAANEIITTLLINKEVEDAMDKGGEPSSSTNNTNEKFDTSNEINSDGTAGPGSNLVGSIDEQRAVDNRNNPDLVPDADLPRATPTATTDIATPIPEPFTNADAEFVSPGEIEMTDFSKKKDEASPPEASAPPLSMVGLAKPSVEASAPPLPPGDIEMTDLSKIRDQDSELPPPKTGGSRKTVVKRSSSHIIKKGGGKKEMQDAAEIIVKICGNMSVLINQITPESFEGYWKILTPLMKPKYQNENNIVETEKLKNDLFQLVVTRDNVGESMWYIYAGILVTSIVQLKIATRGCVKSTAQMEKDYQAFLDEEAIAQANKDKLEETTYTL